MCTQPENRAPSPHQPQTGGQNTTPYYGCYPPTAIYVHAFPPMQFDHYSPVPLPISPFLRPIMSEMRDGARAVSDSAPAFSGASLARNLLVWNWRKNK